MPRIGQGTRSRHNVTLLLCLTRSCKFPKYIWNHLLKSSSCRLSIGNVSKILVQAVLSLTPPGEYFTQPCITKRVDYAISLLIFIFLETSLQNSYAGSRKQQNYVKQEKSRSPKYRPLIYHGLMSREVAEESLVNGSPGLFLIRSSNTAGKDYVLSIRYHN